MSRSYKKTPYCSCKKNKFAKNQANRKIRRNKDELYQNREFRKVYDSWDICDYGEVGISFEEYWRQAQITSDPYAKGQLLKKAMDLYKDGVLPSLSGEQWIMPTIAHYSLRYIGVVNQLLAALEKAKDYVCIYEYANIAVQSLPGNLDAQYWLIYSMNRLGNQDIARNQLRAAEQVLTDEDYRELLHRLADKFLTS